MAIRRVKYTVLNNQWKNRIFIITVFSFLSHIFFFHSFCSQFNFYLFNNPFSTYRLAYCSFLPPRNYIWRKMDRMLVVLIKFLNWRARIFNNWTVLIHATLWTNWFNRISSRLKNSINRSNLILMKNNSSCFHIWLNWSIQLFFFFFFLLFFQNIGNHVFFKKLISGNII